MLSRDGWGGLVVLATSLLLFWRTLGLQDNPLVPVGPGFYPRIVLALTAVLAAWLLIGSWKARRRKAEADAGPSNIRGVVVQFTLFGVYVLSLYWLGFRFSTFLYVAAANALMDPPRGWKGALRVAALAFLTALLAWFVFERQLSVLLPRGRWTGF